MAKGGTHDKGRKEKVEGFQVYRYSTRPLGKLAPVLINRLVSLLTWARYARKHEADIISGHDITGLFIGWLSTLFLPKKKKPKLIYDAHEFEIGRTAKRTRLQVWFITRLERFLMRRSDLSIMVNDTIADEVQKIHRLETRPIVVRNIPNYWHLDTVEIANKREMMIDTLQVDPDVALLSYHGSVSPGRGIEMLINVISQIEGVCAIILGDGDPSYLTMLNELVERLEVKSRVLFLPAVSIEKLPDYIAAIDIAFILINSISISYYWSLPNKIFESIQALVPIVASEYPEIGKLTKEYGIGITVDPDNTDEIISAVKKIISDKDYYTELKNNLHKAKEELCWEKEKKILAEAFLNL